LLYLRLERLRRSLERKVANFYYLFFQVTLRLRLERALGLMVVERGRNAIAALAGVLACKYVCT
jgi:hypothetical protein